MAPASDVSSSPVLVSDASSSSSPCSSPSLVVVSESDLSDSSEPARGDLTRVRVLRAEQGQPQTESSDADAEIASSAADAPAKTGTGGSSTSKPKVKGRSASKSGVRDAKEAADAGEEIPATALRKDLRGLENKAAEALQADPSASARGTDPSTEVAQLGEVARPNADSQLSLLLSGRCPKRMTFSLFSRGRKKTVMPFLAYVLITASVLLLSDPCGISPSRRKDCGYPGITGPECVFYARWLNFAKRKNAGPKFIVRTLCGWMSLGSGLWAVSGYETSGLLIYFLLALVATFQQTSCCYDGQQEQQPGIPGVPHCYC